MGRGKSLMVEMSLRRGQRPTEEVAGKLTLVEANCQPLGTAQLQEKLS